MADDKTTASLRSAIKAGELGRALDEVQNAIRKAPGDVDLRVFLFQLLCIQGNWSRALMQLQAVAKLDTTKLEFVQAYHHLINAEAFRAEVFKGNKTPLVFGDSAPWVADLLSAIKCDAHGQGQAAAALRAQALEAAPAIACTVNGTASDWLADADSRIGPVLELMVNGGFYWVPQAAVKSITFDPVEDLRDLIWRPLSITFATEGKFVAFMPVRYPGSEASSDARHQLSRLTEWQPLHDDAYSGLGQRLFATPDADVAMLEVETLEFAAA